MVGLLPKSHIMELDRLADAELAKRSLRVGFIYVPLSIIVSLITDLSSDFPRQTTGFILLFLLMGVIRSHFARNFESNYNPQNWIKKFTIYTLIPALALGSVAPLVFFYQGAGWDFIICILSVTGVSAGASSSLSPRKKIFRVFQTVLLVPTILTLVIFGEGKAQALSVLVLLWLGQVLVLGRYFHQEFWAGLHGQHQLKLRAKALEKAKARVEEASLAKGNFLANMSHEIRTPLNGIIGMTDLVLESDLDQDQLSYLNDVKSSGETLLRIINEILDFSKIEAGAIQIETIPFSMKKVIEKVVRSLRFSAESRANKISFTIDPELPRILMGDPHRLWQILTNLTGNAVKFTENGEISLSAEKVGEKNSRYSVIVKVRDTGIGISPEAQKSIFNAFSQADGSTTRKFGGTGLGLAISQKLVELMDGTITLNSTEGEGSTFAFMLNLEEAAVQSIEAIEDGEQSRVSDLTGLRVLLAEDNSVNAKLATRLLEKSGVLVEWAQNGKEALDALQNNIIDVILMDVQMPVMDGFETTAEIRKIEAGREKRIPIVALTAHALDGYRDLCLEKGMDDFLTKPLNSVRLRNCLGLWAPPSVQQSVQQSDPQSV